MSAVALKGTRIAGVDYMPLKVIDTPGGAVMHMLRPDMPLNPGLAVRDGQTVVGAGEIYFSEVLPGCVKAWKRHTRQTQHFAVPSGLLGIALYDDRPGSLTRGALQTFRLGRSGLYALLRIPCGVWYGFTALNGSPAIICNVADIPHDPAEGVKVAPDSPEAAAIPFDWTKAFPADSAE
ncbi:MAG: dTDP-4-dehydrorhamnose 3,5-epimerase [Desulfovibrionaceae bacterium]|nr:dTDP-4-dehydrorhamnose 3,5-epimerase [Desulfovibrionaceae bacterium]